MALLGTANMDVRSLFLDYEIATLFYDQDSIRQVESWTQETLRDCRSGVPEVSTLRRLFEAVLHITAPVV